MYHFNYVFKMMPDALWDWKLIRLVTQGGISYWANWGSKRKGKYWYTIIVSERGKKAKKCDNHTCGLVGVLYSCCELKPCMRYLMPGLEIWTIVATSLIVYKLYDYNSFFFFFFPFFKLLFNYLILLFHFKHIIYIYII